MLESFRVDAYPTYDDLLDFQWQEPAPEYLAVLEAKIVISANKASFWSRARFAGRWKRSEAWARRIIGKARAEIAAEALPPMQAKKCSSAPAIRVPVEVARSQINRKQFSSDKPANLLEARMDVALLIHEDELQFFALADLARRWGWGSTKTSRARRVVDHVTKDPGWDVTSAK